MKILVGFAAIVVTIAALVYLYDRYDAGQRLNASKIEKTQQLINEAVDSRCKEKFGSGYSYRGSLQCCTASNLCQAVN
jgi:hypothetical protein